MAIRKHLLGYAYRVTPRSEGPHHQCGPFVFAPDCAEPDGRLNQNVLATRNPKLTARLSGGSPSRLAARSVCGALLKDAPRTTRRLQSPLNLAVPSPGLPAFFSFQQSSVHSHTLPCTL